jgi:uncharacterized membrane protein YphA (DoxX/SURF4 family)
VRIVFGVIWTVAAFLKWQSAFIEAFADTVSNGMVGQPPAVQTWIALWYRMIQINPILFGYLAALTESLLAICFILGLFTNAACVISIVWSFVIWSVAEGFGGPYVMGQSTDIGTAFPYILISILLLITHAGLYFGLDRKLTARLGRYSFLASKPWQKTRHTLPGLKEPTLK